MKVKGRRVPVLSKRGAEVRSRRNTCCTIYVVHEEHGHDEGAGRIVFLEKGTGVCFGAMRRNGNLEDRDQ